MHAFVTVHAMMTPKLNIAALFVLATFNISFVASINRDDYIRIPTGNCYKFYDNEQWNHGAGKCSVEGGMMYYPNNEQELEKVFRVLDILYGRRLTHVLNKWAPGEPKLNCSKKHLNLGDCSCVQIAVSSHEMSIINCYKIGAYICNHRPNSTVNAETGQLELTCPKGYIYIQLGENYYKYYPGFAKSINWYSAKVKCESDGAELFHPDNPVELEQVLSGFRNTSLGTKRFIFLGFSNLEKLGEYKTVDGHFLYDKYQKWDSMVKSDSNRCGSLYVPNRSLRTLNCWTLQDFICKRRPPAVARVFIHQDNYTKIPVGNYYKFYDYKPYTTWTYAKERCESEGGMMFYPNNEQELEVVFRGLNVYSRIKKQPQEVPKDLYIGYSDPNSDGLLKTVDGRHLTYVWTKWIKGAPLVRCYYDKHPPCSCVQMGVHSHEISINNCLKARPFICNHRPNTNRTVNAVTGELEPICPYGYTYIQIADNDYKYYEGVASKTNWYGAKDKCKSDGAELFHPDNLSELEQVLSAMRKRNTSFSTRRSIFLGFFYQQTPKDYKSVDGRFLHDKYHEWGPKAPLVPDDWYRCGGLLVLKRHLILNSCFVYKDFICRIRRPLNVTVAAKQFACGENYKYVPSLKSCYKYNKYELNWETARAICQSEGGDLFHPDDEQELNLVLAEFGLPTRMHEVLYVGFSDLEKHGVFKTVTGRPLKQVFAKWLGFSYWSCWKNCNCGYLLVGYRRVFTGHCTSLQRYICKRAAAV